MVKKNEKDGSSKPQQPSSAAHSGIKCIGAVCFNADTGKIEITLNRADCDIGVVESLVENIVKGAEVEFKIPKPGQAQD